MTGQNDAPVYLGDNVTASFDGWHVGLKADGLESKVIYLDPSVFAAVVDFAVEHGVYQHPK